MANETHVAVLDDGPAAGMTVPVDVARILPPLFITTDPVMHLDETTETVEWRPARYSRAALYKIRRPGDPWHYFHHPAPGA